MSRLVYIDKQTVAALEGDRRYIILPCRGLYDRIFEDLSFPCELALELVCGDWRRQLRCRASCGYAPKEWGGYVGQRYYIFTKSEE